MQTAVTANAGMSVHFVYVKNGFEANGFRVVSALKLFSASGMGDLDVGGAMRDSGLGLVKALAATAAMVLLAFIMIRWVVAVWDINTTGGARFSCSP